VISMRRQREVCLSDGRISGGGNFVEKMVEEAEERQKHLFSGSEVTVKKLMESLCRKGITRLLRNFCHTCKIISLVIVIVFNDRRFDRNHHLP
jgi:hypothetical protein